MREITELHFSYALNTIVFKEVFKEKCHETLCKKYCKDRELIAERVNCIEMM